MLLSERAERAARHAALPRWVLVADAGLRCGLPAARAREIVDVPHLTRVPGTEAHVRGLMNLRGRPLTVFGLAGVLQGEEQDADTDVSGGTRTGKPQVVVVQDGDRLVGFLVDAVLAVAPAAVDADAGLPAGVDPRSVAGMCEHDGETFLGLDASGLVRSLFD